MTSTRRAFLAALAAGTGAILMGRGWHRRGSGLVVPEWPDATNYIANPDMREWTAPDRLVEGWFLYPDGRFDIRDIPMRETRPGLYASIHAVDLTGVKDYRFDTNGLPDGTMAEIRVTQPDYGMVI